MNDQAERLRRRIQQRDGEQYARTIAIASGKGGVGKSNLTLNFALKLIEQNKRVIIFDLDIGMGNIDILMGVSPSSSIVDLFKDESTIQEIIEWGPNNLAYIAGGSGLAEIFKMDSKKFDYFKNQFEKLSTSFDYILFDMGAGVTETTLHFLAAAHEVIIVTTPEPTSITDGYAMMKHLIRYENDVPIAVIVNRTNQNKEGYQTFSRLRTVVHRFLEKDIAYLGMLPDDRDVLRAVNHQSPFVLDSPNCRASEAMESIVTHYLKGNSALPSSFPSPSFLSKLKRYILTGNR
ncbi:MinD/ParA family protein [Halobacillus sp. BBL2006]|uniref:MinD/ParA family protein n=1 Tax=Halobacillus sp. BBL2006 TaxID=1543706 RepID=UPI0005429286|nr:MinD/ParA family protein [Halobacillus sp. BBL2006]KHE71274.1 cobyrinic acid a,c-diamide synthase [Halobacillus sp. BBL2006]